MVYLRLVRLHARTEEALRMAQQRDLQKCL